MQHLNYWVDVCCIGFHHQPDVLFHRGLKVGLGKKWKELKSRCILFEIFECLMMVALWTFHLMGIK